MKVCGIISEYNPFHYGHLHHICETRRILGEDTAIIACMSGNFTQRGEAAVIPKHERAALAIKGGADLVVELPVTKALATAETFAAAGVEIFGAMGIVTHISFGAECDDISRLKSIASLLLEQQTVLDTLANMSGGSSYAAARERALYSRIKEEAELIETPNNILAIEYIKALIKTGSPIIPVAVKRIGAGHDSLASSETMSAFAIREKLREGEDISAFVPNAPEGRMLTDDSTLKRMLHFQLLRLSPEQIASAPGMDGGLEHRLFKAVHTEGSWEAIAASVKTKRYALSRIRRGMLCAALGITAADSLSPGPHIKILASNERGRLLLGKCRKAATLPALSLSRKGRTAVPQITAGKAMIQTFTPRQVSPP